MTAALPETPSIPHSRWNDLEETALAAAGYEILTRSAVAGVDAFRRGGEGLSLYFQGHPEYDADSLMREYGRDVGRFLRGERPAHPSVPVGYLSPESERALQQLAERARGRPDPGQLPAYYAILNAACPKQVWRAAAVALYRAWLGQVAGPSGMPSRGSRSRLLVPPPRVV
jgi:homoserine O-succinyltransferase